MSPPGTSTRGIAGKVFLWGYLLVPILSLLVYYLRRAKHPIKRSGRPKVAFVLMFIAMACAVPIPLVEAYGWSFVSCLTYNAAVTLFPPLFITPMLVSQIQHYRGARIHAKMAEHATQASSAKGSTRDKTQFEKLVSDLKSERLHLRRNVILMYVQTSE